MTPDYLKTLSPTISRSHSKAWGEVCSNPSLWLGHRVALTLLYSGMSLGFKAPASNPEYFSFSPKSRPLERKGKVVSNTATDDLQKPQVAGTPTLALVMLPENRGMENGWEEALPAIWAVQSDMWERKIRMEKTSPALSYACKSLLHNTPQPEG